MHVLTKGALASTAALGLGLVIIVPAAGQEGDLDCGDPGTSHNMPIEIGNDPHGLDADQDGIGCEDPSVFGGAAPSEPSSPAPAEPVEAEPDFTG